MIGALPKNGISLQRVRARSSLTHLETLFFYKMEPVRKETIRMGSCITNMHL